MNITPLGLTGEAALAYASFGDMFPVVIVLMDPDMRCTWASPGARSVLGYEPEAMVGVSVADIV
ncbi:MAG: PAS domain-containing protein, partial [Microthrixaceae bacterium]|nr:PAS domain-containing protein [Microthrixaceae bacterium]